jgi:hypothetical protein
MVCYDWAPPHPLDTIGGGDFSVTAGSMSILHHTQTASDVSISTKMKTNASLFLVFILFISCSGMTTTNAASVFNNHKSKLEDDLYLILGLKKRTATIVIFKRHIDNVPKRHILIRVHHLMPMKNSVVLWMHMKY